MATSSRMGQQRAVYMPDAVWNAAREVSERELRSITASVTVALMNYIWDRHPDLAQQYGIRQDKP